MRRATLSRHIIIYGAERIEYVVAAHVTSIASKQRYVKAREHLAIWVRGLGVNDPEVLPNHAWRHTFKAIGFRCGISEKVLDAMVGHAPASVGRAYGEPTLADKAQELRRFPRYKLGG